MLALAAPESARDLDRVTVLVTRSVMMDVTCIVVVGSLELTLTLLLLLLLESGVSGEVGGVLGGSAALLISVLDASSDVELLLVVEIHVLRSG